MMKHEPSKEYADIITTLVLTESGVNRLDRLCRRFRTNRSAIVEVALKLYEDYVDEVDTDTPRYTGKCFEAFVEDMEDE